MIRWALKDASPVRQFVEIGSHVTFVVWILIEIIFNYYMCVTTRNTGPSYDKVVRELAKSTDFDYPTTPQEVDRFRRDFNDKMMLRMRRRQARETEQRQRQRQRSSSRCCDDHGNCSSQASIATETVATTLNGQLSAMSTNNGGSDSNIAIATAAVDPTVKLRKTTRQQQQSSSKNSTSNIIVTPNKQIRSWMLMAPDEWGYCQRTNQPKPPRSHYDHVSKTLVPCMDHYCPWMFNAIGYFNYRYFVNFLIFVFLGMMYGAFIAYRPFINSTSIFYREQVAKYRKTGIWSHIHPYTPISAERMPLSLSFMLCLAVGLAVCCLGSFHLYLVLTGQTTIEFHANYVSKTKARRSGQKYRNPYDMGWKRNWEQVYGYRSSMLSAFLIPSTREPDYLPIPISGEKGKRVYLRRNSSSNKRSIEAGNMYSDDDDNNIQLQQTEPFLESSGLVNIV